MWQQRARLTNGLRDALGIPDGQIASVDDLIEAVRKAHKAEQDTVAGKQLRELVEAIKTLSDGQTRMAELLKDIHAEQQQQRAAMVKLAAMIEGKADRNYRPN
jgi:uncharacterized protein (UPF0335 family)